MSGDVSEGVRGEEVSDEVSGEVSGGVSEEVMLVERWC